MQYLTKWFNQNIRIHAFIDVKWSNCNLVHDVKCSMYQKCPSKCKHCLFNVNIVCCEQVVENKLQLLLYLSLYVTLINYFNIWTVYFSAKQFNRHTSYIKNNSFKKVFYCKYGGCMSLWLILKAQHHPTWQSTDM